jgi:hypothetical protein
VDLGSGLLGFVVADAAGADVVLGDCDMVGWLVDGVRVVCCRQVESFEVGVVKFELLTRLKSRVSYGAFNVEVPLDK